MLSTHNTALQKNASEIIETNSLAPINFEIPNTIQPIVRIQPYIDVVETVNNSSGSGTLFVCPSDKDFYLTNIALSATGDSGGVVGTTTVGFTLRNGKTKTISLSTDFSAGSVGSTLSQSIVFPLRGVLLAKSSNITYSISGSLMIAGYLSSDRSGI